MRWQSVNLLAALGVGVGAVLACAPPPPQPAAQPPLGSAAPTRPDTSPADETASAKPPAMPENTSPATPGATTPELTLDRIPAAMQSCFGCHAGTVRAFLVGHGMAGSIAGPGRPEPGAVVNGRNGRRYVLSGESDGPWLTTTNADGGQRRQRIVGRIGAGNFATSWVTAEADVLTSAPTGRLFFAPVETIRDRGLALAPFEHHDPAPGPDMELTQGCMTCHATQRLHELPTAATGGAGSVFPGNALGAEAFGQLRGIGCDACHGDTSYHEEVMGGLEASIGSGLLTLGELPAATQRDICARCHLQGDTRWELIAGAPTTATPLGGQIPVLVPAAPDMDFRFVGQVERLALSSCFAATPEMTCTTCHEAHVGAAAQGTTAFDRRCFVCHSEPRSACSRSPELDVAAVTGTSPRSDNGCVDCHMRRSQPFDLTEVTSADHWIRRRIEPRESGGDHRQFADPKGPLQLFDRQLLARDLESPGGRLWERAVRAMGFATMARLDEARAEFAGLPAPGTPEATRAVAAGPLAPVLTLPDLHLTRALVLLASGELDAAHSAFGDALRLDPAHPGARLGRARLGLDRGDIAGMLADTQAIIEAFPQSEQPWRLRLELAERVKRFDLAQRSLEAITERWPSDAVAWHKLGLILLQKGDRARGNQALERARLLSPSLDLRSEAAPAPGPNS